MWGVCHNYKMWFYHVLALKRCVHLSKEKKNVKPFHFCSAHISLKLWVPEGCSMPRTIIILVWEPHSSRVFRAWTVETGILFCVNQCSKVFTTFIHSIWLMLAISQDATVPQKDMMDGIYAPNPFLHQTLKQFTTSQNSGFSMPLTKLDISIYHIYGEINIWTWYIDILTWYL